MCQCNRQERRISVLNELPHLFPLVCSNSLYPTGFDIFPFVFFVLSGAGPHPKALSGRIICCSWWLFTVVLLACYFSNLSSSKSPESSQLTVKGFEDLANQDMIEYGCLAGSSTLAFFKVRVKKC